ncbi:MAG: putative Zinc metalloprotease [Promethearchaeota archaeon]|nr:MAG: putative Zinc metalloprotease [Candidatus Lokiarchaeota archaeon]
MRIGTVKGIEIKLHLSTLVIVGLVGFYAAQVYYVVTGSFDIAAFIIVGLINGFIILGSIIAHELMHSIVSLRNDLKVSEIELYMFGGVSNIEEEPKTPKSEMKISVVGPLISLLIGGIFLAVYYISIFGFGIQLPLLSLLNIGQTSAASPVLSVIGITLWYSGISNVGLGIFNLIPAFPMDGGRVLRAFLWKRRNNLLSATESASRIGYYFGWLMVGFGFFQIIFLTGIGGFWFIILGFFLSNSSKQAYQQTVYEFKLSKITAKEIQMSPSEMIPSDTSITNAIKDYFMKYRKAFFPVSKNDEVVGVVTIDDVKRIPIKERQERSIEEAMIRVGNYPSIEGKDTGKKAFNKLRSEEQEPKLVVVKENNHISGFITQNEIQSAIRLSSLLFGEEIEPDF